MTAPVFSIIMNIMLNFCYGNLIGFYFLKIGDYYSFILGMVLLILYVILCLSSLISQCNGKKTYFDVIFNLCHKLDKSISLDEMISINRKLYPSIIVGCVAKHEESREVWEEYEEYDVPVYETVTEIDEDGNQTTKEVLDHYETDYRLYKTHYSPWERDDKGGGHFNNPPSLSYHTNKFEKRVEHKTVETWRKELDYVYESWQDDTKNIENVKYCSIINATFNYQIFLIKFLKIKFNK